MGGFLTRPGDVRLPDSRPTQAATSWTIPATDGAPAAESCRRLSDTWPYRRGPVHRSLAAVPWCTAASACDPPDCTSAWTSAAYLQPKRQSVRWVPDSTHFHLSWICRRTTICTIDPRHVESLQQMHIELYEYNTSRDGNWSVGHGTDVKKNIFMFFIKV